MKFTTVVLLSLPFLPFVLPFVLASYAKILLRTCRCPRHGNASRGTVTITTRVGSVMICRARPSYIVCGVNNTVVECICASTHTTFNNSIDAHNEVSEISSITLQRTETVTIRRFCTSASGNNTMFAYEPAFGVRETAAANNGDYICTTHHHAITTVADTDMRAHNAAYRYYRADWAENSEDPTSDDDIDDFLAAAATAAAAPPPPPPPPNAADGGVTITVTDSHTEL